jgi:hypothetical protein
MPVVPEEIKPRHSHNINVFQSTLMGPESHIDLTGDRDRAFLVTLNVRICVIRGSRST